MKYKLLFGNNIEGTGKKLAKTFSHFGFETKYCANNIDTLEETLKGDNYNGIIFYALRITDNIYNFISKCKSIYPDIKIYPIISSNSQQIKNNLINAGAASCIVLPCTDYSICSDVINDFFSSDELIILPEIADFLFKKGFPNQIIGFYFLCCAVEYAIVNPESLSKVTILLYPKVAEIMNTTYKHVERALRVLAIAAFQKGVVINEEVTYRRMKTRDMIAVLAEEYTRKYGL